MLVKNSSAIRHCPIPETALAYFYKIPTMRTLLFILLAPLANASFHGPLVQWVAKPSETAHVIWLEKIDKSAANQKSDYTIQYEAGAENRQASATVSTLPGSHHRIIRADLTGLKPDHIAKFRLVPEKGPPTEYFSFKTAPKDPADIRFVTGGDLFHERKPMDEMNRQAGLSNPLFALIGGDLAYTNDNNPDQWTEYFDSWTENARTPDGRLVPKIIVIGNHEVSNGGFNPTNAHGPEKAREFYAIFDFPDEKSATYILDFGDWLSFVLLDSGHTRNVADQIGFLETSLEARDKVPHLFVCYHRPAYGMNAKPDCKEIQQDWCPLFEKHRVTAVFENDHHQFVRSHPITAGKIDKENGIPYLGAGAWSVRTRPVDQAEFNKRPWIANANDTNHIYLIETKAKSFTATAIDVNGKAFDSYTREWIR